jgi:hypothetical protein
MFIPADESPIADTPLLVVANEVSGSTTVYAVGEPEALPESSTPMTNTDWVVAAEQTESQKASRKRGPVPEALDMLLAKGMF